MASPSVTYTPDGHPRAPGYLNPNNPWDTGYKGQRNPEKVGQSKNTDPNWDYDHGRPKGNLPLDASGNYAVNYGGPGSGGSGAGGSSVIPGAGTYLADQASAEKAYQDAVAQLKATRYNQQRLSGFMDSPTKSWIVDPLSTVGAYQQMLGGEGSELDANIANNQAHGFFGLGLGNQGERSIRFDQAANNFGFQNQLGQYEADYQRGLTGAASQRQAAMLAALQAAQAAAYGAGNWSDYGDSGSAGQGDQSTGPAPVPAYRPPRIVGSASAYNRNAPQNRGITPRFAPKVAPKPLQKPPSWAIPHR